MKDFFVSSQRGEWLSYCHRIARDAVLFARGLPGIHSMPEAISAGAHNLGLPAKHVAYIYHGKALNVRRHTYEAWRRAAVRECVERERIMTERLIAAWGRRKAMETDECGTDGPRSATGSFTHPCR